MTAAHNARATAQMQFAQAMTAAQKLPHAEMLVAVAEANKQRDTAFAAIQHPTEGE